MRFLAVDTVRVERLHRHNAAAVIGVHVLLAALLKC
jgi:hypothetical protein